MSVSIEVLQKCEKEVEEKFTKLLEERKRKLQSELNGADNKFKRKGKADKYLEKLHHILSKIDRIEIVPPSLSINFEDFLDLVCDDQGCFIGMNYEMLVSEMAGRVLNSEVNYLKLGRITREWAKENQKKKMDECFDELRKDIDERIAECSVV